MKDALVVLGQDLIIVNNVRILQVLVQLLFITNIIQVSLV